eukprot:CAMPEP_0113933572 /NCGR_PEP_ID=MMETSP1339-20121228/662_1 /TAXON_ID=94617 /ORGANISM="Fibrocapsa japonica" /LENGTH=116 /DNA_ID=CAMNT_0000934889 /DNA_START=146 /DNA_END=496 /DNA_ORIENTATION=- /assembly_acc=CAM_ASM_000762
MRHVATYLMLVLGGNASPTAEDVTNALSAVGVEADADRLNTLITELEGKDLKELLELGKEKLAKFGGGGGAVAAAGGAAGGGGGDAGAAEEEKKEEEEEEEIDMGAGDMFGGDSDY